jgi:UPF0755 protein
MRGKIVVLAIVVVGILIFCASLWNAYLHKPGPLQTEVTIEIPKGSASGQIAELLTYNGVTNSFVSFKIAAKLSLMEKSLKAGEYTFQPHISLKDVINKIAKGQIIQHFITFPEGWTAAQVAEKLQRQEGLTGSILYLEEGTLLPQTYAYNKGDERADVIKSMQDDMREVVAEIWRMREQNNFIQKPMDLITLASIVEKETSKVEEQAHIAGVYLNRLKQRMRLQADPTVIYGAKSFNGDITREHLKQDHPYNTYTRHGLPFGPICNPGKSALYASAHPEVTEDLYFVSDGNGAHVFAKTLQEHTKNVKNYLKIYRSKHK